MISDREPESFDDIKSNLKLKVEQDETSLSALITDITPLKESTCGMIIYVLLGIVTLGFYTLLCYWLPKQKIKLLYNKIVIREATNLSIADDNNDIEICKVKKDWVNTGTFRIFTYTFYYRLLTYYWNSDIERFV